jgi:hypothetical protein
MRKIMTIADNLLGGRAAWLTRIDQFRERSLQEVSRPFIIRNALPVKVMRDPLVFAVYRTTYVIRQLCGSAGVLILHCRRLRDGPEVMPT